MTRVSRTEASSVPGWKAGNSPFVSHYWSTAASDRPARTLCGARSWSITVDSPPGSLPRCSRCALILAKSKVGP